MDHPAIELRRLGLGQKRLVLLAVLLADRGLWLAPESSFCRVLKAAGQQSPRGCSRPPVKRALSTHVADDPNQLWCWDISWLRSDHAVG